MSCSSRKLNKVSKKSKRSFSKKTQRGGVSNACVLDYTNDKAMYSASGAGESNEHNLNPQASLDLDNKFMNYGGPIPLEQSGGATKCGDDGVGTSHPRTETFKQYIKNETKNQMTTYTHYIPVHTLGFEKIKTLELGNVSIMSIETWIDSISITGRECLESFDWKQYLKDRLNNNTPEIPKNLATG